MDDEKEEPKQELQQQAPAAESPKNGLSDVWKECGLPLAISCNSAKWKGEEQPVAVRRIPGKQK